MPDILHDFPITCRHPWFTSCQYPGWPAVNEHYRISSYCWAMYLRILQRYLEHNESVPYESRLTV